MMNTTYLICIGVGITFLLILFLVYYFYFRKGNSLALVFIDEKKSTWKSDNSNKKIIELKVTTTKELGVFHEEKIQDNGYLYYISYLNATLGEKGVLRLDDQILATFEKSKEPFNKFIEPIQVKQDQKIRLEFPVASEAAQVTLTIYLEPAKK